MKREMLIEIKLIEDENGCNHTVKFIGTSSRTELLGLLADAMSQVPPAVPAQRMSDTQQ